MIQAALWMATAHVKHLNPDVQSKNTNIKRSLKCEVVDMNYMNFGGKNAGFLFLTYKSFDF